MNAPLRCNMPAFREQTDNRTEAHLRLSMDSHISASQMRASLTLLPFDQELPDLHDTVTGYA